MSISIGCRTGWAAQEPSARRTSVFFCGGLDALPGKLQFWREAPRIGLTGVAWIEIGELGVSAERVAYDLNVASDLLRGPC
jgi:hypothetical protein